MGKIKVNNPANSSLEIQTLCGASCSDTSQSSSLALGSCLSLKRFNNEIATISAALSLFWLYDAMESVLLMEVICGCVGVLRGFLWGSCLTNEDSDELCPKEGPIGVYWSSTRRDGLYKEDSLWCCLNRKASDEVLI